LKCHKSLIWNCHVDSTQLSLLRQLAVSLWSWYPVFHRPSQSPSTGADVISVVLTH
jgi:hypothetical protein